jgi:hypothetical protein
MKIARMLSVVLVLVAVGGADAQAGGNTAVNLKGVVTTSTSKPSTQPAKRPTHVVPRTGNSGAVVAPEEIPVTEVNPQAVPTCWGDNCGETRLQSGG